MLNLALSVVTNILILSSSIFIKIFVICYLYYTQKTLDVYVLDILIVSIDYFYYLLLLLISIVYKQIVSLIIRFFDELTYIFFSKHADDDALNTYDSDDSYNNSKSYFYNAYKYDRYQEFKSEYLRRLDFHLFFIECLEYVFFFIHISALI